MSAVSETLSRLYSGAASARGRHPAWRLLLSDLFLYGLVSAAALALDWGLLILLVKAGLYYQIASALSFTAGMLLAYAGSVVFIFGSRRQRGFAAEAIGFFAIGLLGLACNQALLFVFVHFAGLPVGLAKAPTAVCVFTFNFFARRTLLFAAEAGRAA